MMAVSAARATHGNTVVRAITTPAFFCRSQGSVFASLLLTRTDFVHRMRDPHCRRTAVLKGLSLRLRPLAGLVMRATVILTGQFPPSRTLGRRRVQCCQRATSNIDWLQGAHVHRGGDGATWRHPRLKPSGERDRKDEICHWWL